MGLGKSTIECKPLIIPHAKICDIAQLKPNAMLFACFFTHSGDSQAVTQREIGLWGLVCLLKHPLSPYSQRTLIG